MVTATEYAHMTANEFTKDQVVMMEREVARVLDYDIDTCTVNDALHLLFASEPRVEDQAVMFMALYLADLNQLSSNMTCRYTANELALACHILASIELEHADLNY